MSNFDYDKLEVALLSNEDLSKCNFKEDDESDPLGVDDFIHYKISTYKQNNLSVIYIVKYNKETVGFFTVSMGALEVKKMKETDKIEDVSQLISYPALLLGNMGVEKKFRKQGIGKWICKFCIGLAIEFSSKIACGYVFLQSDHNKRRFYEKLDFITSGKQNKDGKIWMYRKIFSKIFHPELHDHVHVSESVTVTRIPANK